MRSPAAAFLVRVVVVGALLITWALGIGRYGGPDEPAHVLRSFAAAHGDVLGDPADPLPAGYRVVSVPASLASGDPACYRHDARITSQCGTPEDSSVGTGRVRVATSAGLTPPLYHLAIGAIVRLIGDPGDTAWYRGVAALLHAVVIAVTLTRLRRRPRMTALVLAAITPAAWFLFGVVNPNSLEVALALLGWVGVARFIEASPPTAADAWWISAPVAMAVAIRPIALVVVVAMAVTLALRARPARHRSVLAGPVAIAVAAVLAWHLMVDVQIDDPRTAVHRSVLASLGDALGSLHITATEAVGSLGWNEFDAPLPVTLMWVAVWLTLLAITLVAVRRDTGHVRALLVWLAVLIGTPVVFEVVFAGSLGPIWQGRYSLPMLLGLPVMISLPRRPAATRALVALVGLAALAEVATYWVTVRRYSVGSDGSWWLTHAFGSTAWLGPRAWLVVHVALVAAAAAAVVIATRRPDGDRNQAM